MTDSTQQQGKLSELLGKWPKGAVVVQGWLDTQGISRQLTDRYCRFHWMRRIGRGAYARLNESVEWTGGLYAIQQQLGLPIHAGAKTALELQGYAHYIPMRKGATQWLFGPPKVKPPSWFLKHDWEDKTRYVATNLFQSSPELGLTKKPIEDYSIKLSAPERAMLEFLDQLPASQAFEESQQLMEGLATLRPELVQQLLENCRSVKAKRLFLLLAEICGHQWLSSLDLKKVDLGKGKRLLVKGGHFDQKYQISVPFQRPDKEQIPA
ncbi:MAG: type IV toxin-antitoxin system AbiEi family antitoxin [Elusimicrobia bacterium]|nr:type IV toxin-antitoxin system AbiEi family antitoxin [Elusimicrobiota bacterium]